MIGLLDSGVGGPLCGPGAARRFSLDGAGEVAEGPAEADPLGHGTAVAELIVERARGVPLFSAQVFDRRGLTSAAVVAAGLDWLVGQGVRIVNMSLGLTEDRVVLAEACARARAAGVLLVASVPAIGPLVFPAAYPGVVRVTGDARCQGDQIARLDGTRADFGANPWPDGIRGGGHPDGRPRIAGASVAAARVSGSLARLLVSEGSGEAACQALAATAAHRGPQEIPGRSTERRGVAR